MADRETLKRYARLGGGMYLLVLALYVAGDQMTSGVLADGDFAQVAARLQASETAYRCGLALQLASSVATVLLGGAFFVLLSPVNRNLALFAFIWRVIEAVFGGIMVTTQFAALAMYLGPVSNVAPGQQAGLAELARVVAHASFPVSVVYFAAGSIVYFYLMFKPRIIPRLLAAFGLVASLLVAMMGSLTLVAPGAASSLGILWAPIFFAEVMTGGWLLLKGANLAHVTHE